MCTPRLNVQANEECVIKKLFNLKPMKKNGLILRVVHSDSNVQKIRFIHATFNKTGNVLAAADISGTIFIIDFLQTKFWGMIVLDSCTVLKFSSFNDDEILVGVDNGDICIVDIQTATINGQLIGHVHPVTELSFSHDHMCLSASQCEAFIWNLQTNTKIQVLNLHCDCNLKHVLFMPITGNVIACFYDDVIQVWKYGSFERFKEIQPTSWNKNSIRCLAFTRNGRAMVVGGYSPYLNVFLVDTWCLSKTITLPEQIQTVKKLDFVPQPFDGGCNRVLVILSGDGILYFYDMEQNVILNTLIEKLEVIRYECCVNGKYIACVLCSGEVTVYNITHYLVPCVKENLPKAIIAGGKSKGYKCAEKMGLIQKQLKEILSIDKLRAILKEFGQYPNMYRMEIWKELLQLPNNKDYYNSIINRKSHNAFSDLEKKYPLMNKLALKNLKRVLNNIVTWCPFFGNVEGLPLLIFPFVKVFENNPIVCFEAVCTILVNWCQYWWEYHPLPPINTLAMIENVFLQHNPKLLDHLSKHNVTSTIYAWRLLENAFSEVLAVSEWSIFWDHVLTNEPSFLLMAVVSYNCLQQTMLLSMSDFDGFKQFYHSQNPINVKRLVSKTYFLLNNTIDKYHPRLYLNYFKKIEMGSYPQFNDYPKTIVDYETSASEYVKQEEELFEQKQAELLADKINEQQMLLTMEIMDAENARLKEMERVSREKMDEQRRHVEEHRKKLCDLRNQLHLEKTEMLNLCKNKVLQQNMKDRERELERLNTDIDMGRFYEESEIVKAQEDLLQHYSKLLKNKVQIHNLDSTNYLEDDTRSNYLLLKQHQKELHEEIKKVRQKAHSGDELKQLVISTGIAALDNLITHVEVQLDKETAHSKEYIGKDTSIVRLEAATKDLETEVQKLLKLLAECRLRKNKIIQERVVEGPAKIKEKRTVSLIKDAKQPYTKNVSNKKGDGKTKQIMHSARDGYEARHTSPVSVCKCCKARKYKCRCSKGD